MYSQYDINKNVFYEIKKANLKDFWSNLSESQLSTLKKIWQNIC